MNAAKVKPNLAYSMMKRNLAQVHFVNGRNGSILRAKRKAWEEVSSAEKIMDTLKILDEINNTKT